MSSKPKRNSRPNRFGIGFLSVFQIMLMIAVVVFINYIASQNYDRADFSRTADYSLSSSTENYLRSDAVSKRKRPIKLTMVYRRSSTFYERVRALAEEYARVSEGKVEIDVIDPIRLPDLTQQFTTTYNLTLVRDLILVDARPTEETPIITETATGTPSLSPHITLALGEEMITFAIDQSGQRRPDVFRGEDLLTARLVEAVEGKPREFLFLADKSRVDSDDADSPWKKLATTLRYQNIRMNPVNMAGISEIPAAADGIAIVAPKYDFTDQEIEVLETYWNTSQAAFLIMLEAGECPPKLKTFLRSKGLTPRNDRVITLDGSRVVTTVRGHFSKGIPFLKDLSGQSAVFEGASSSIEVRENAEDLSIKRIAPVPLIRASQGYWGESDYRQNTGQNGEGKTFNEMRDHTGPLHIAAAVTRGASNDDRFAAETSRLILMTNTDFLEENRQRAENIDFLASSANWLVARESLAGQTPRTIGTYKLPLLDAQVSFINRLNLFFVPLAFLLVGGLVFSTRRA